MKTFTFLCLGMLMATMALAQGPVITVYPASLQEGLYTGDSLTRPVTVSNSGTTDLSCTITVEPTSATGSVNNALKFDGVNDYGMVYNTPALRLTSQLTIEAWINFEAGGTGQPVLISKGRPIPDYEVFLDTNLQSSKIGLRLNQVGTILSQTTLSAGNDYHVAFTYDGATLCLYINGILDKSMAATGTLSTSNYSFYLAKRDNSTSFRYKGEIDEVRIWNFARLQSDILQSMNHELSGTETGIAGYWKFNEEAGTTVYDASPNNLKLYLYNGTLRIGSGASIINWLYTDLASFTIQPGATATLYVLLNAVGLNGGTYTGKVSIHSNDPANPLVTVVIELVVTPLAHINLSVTELEFGDIFIGSSNTLSFIVSNTGNDTLNITSMTCPDTDFAASPLTLAVPPGENDTVEVIYTPSLPGSDDAELTISSNDLLQPDVTVMLTGTAISPPVIVVSPQSLSATLYSGRQTTQILTVTNTGLSDLVFSVADYQLGGASTGNKATTSQPSWLWITPASDTCEPGASLELMLYYNAALLAGGTYLYDITITSNDPVNPMVIIPVTFQVIDAPCIQASQDTLDFGILYLGYNTGDTLQVEISNMGSYDLLIPYIAVSPSFFTASPAFAGIDPGESQTYTVIFTPANVGDYTGTLTFFSNDPLVDEYSVVLMGKFLLPPEISVTSPMMSAVLYSGETTSQSFTINNTGGSDLEFTISPGTSKALTLDGFGDYVDVPSLNPVQGTPINQFTFECWVYFNALNGNTQYIMQARLNYSWYNYYYFSIFTTDENRLRFTLSDNNYNWHEINSSPVQPATWIHIACTYDGGTEKIYINGVEDGSLSWTSSVSFTSGPILGRSNDYYGYYLNGFLDEARFWNVCRTEDEIQQGMSREFIGSTSGLIGNWRFNELNESIVEDETANNNDGYTYGDAYLSSFSPPVFSWLSCSPASGTCAAGASMGIEAIFNSSFLPGGDYATNIIINSNDPGNPELEIPVTLHVIDAPSLLAGSDTLNFGEVFTGYTKTIYLEVTNNGSQDLLITGISANPTQFSISPPYMSIDAGQTEQVQVVFSPTSAVEYTGMLILNSNDPLDPQTTIYLTGLGILPPVIAVAPATLEIEAHPWQTLTQSFTILNNGGSDLNFSLVPGESSQNKALEFDGIDDFVTLGSGIIISYSSFTLESWAKKTTSSYYNGAHIIWGQGNNYYYSVNAGFIDNDIFTFGFNDDYFNTPNSFPDSEWHHWACTFDASTRARKIYRDGTKVAEDIAWSDYSGSGQLNIGCTGYFNSYFQGSIDEARIWNTARTQEEIKENMDYPLFGDETGLLGYWDFNEGTGLTVKDKTTYGNDGTLANGVSWTNESAPMSPTWLSANPGTGTIPANSSMAIDAIINVQDLAPGDYYANIRIYSNDPANPIVEVPVHLIISSLVGVDDFGFQISDFGLMIYPNPFTYSTTIKYTLPEPAMVNLRIYNSYGQLVNEPVNAFLLNGEQIIEWKTENLPAGVYYCRLQVGDRLVSKKIVKM